MKVSFSTEKFFLVLFFFFIFASLALALSTTQSIISISILVAFLGGVLSLVSPCTVVVLPAFFAYSFKEKKNLTKMTFIFFIGLTLTLIPIGLAASSIGQFFTVYRGQLITISGVILIIFGFLALLGRGFSLTARLIKQNPMTDSKPQNVFLFGLLFGTGFVPCAGPILGAILTLAAASETIFEGLFLMVAYSLGIMLPLFILAFYFDKAKFYQSKLASKSFKLRIGKKKYEFQWVHLISGIIFILLGSIFITYRGTNIFTEIFARYGLLQFFLDLQDQVFALSPFLNNYISVALLIPTGIIILYLYRLRK